MSNLISRVFAQIICLIHNIKFRKQAQFMYFIYILSLLQFNSDFFIISSIINICWDAQTAQPYDIFRYSIVPSSNGGMAFRREQHDVRKIHNQRAAPGNAIACSVALQ